MKSGFLQTNAALAVAKVIANPPFSFGCVGTVTSGTALLWRRADPESIDFTTLKALINEGASADTLKKNYKTNLGKKNSERTIEEMASDPKAFIQSVLDDDE